MIDFCPDLLPVLYAGVNALAFALFAIDKISAKLNAVRIPEPYLIVAAAIGPAGALAGMLLLRHKTRIRKFLLVPFFLILHLFLLLLVSPCSAG